MYFSLIKPTFYQEGPIEITNLFSKTWPRGSHTGGGANTKSIITTELLLLLLLILVVLIL